MFAIQWRALVKGTSVCRIAADNAAVRALLGILCANQRRAGSELTSQLGVAADKTAIGTLLDIVGASNLVANEPSTANGATALIDIGRSVAASGRRSGAGKQRADQFAIDRSTANGATALIDIGRSVAASVRWSGAFEQRAGLTHETATPDHAAVLVKNRAVVFAKIGRGGTGWWRGAFLGAIGARAQLLGVSTRCEEQYGQAERSHHLFSTVG
jgi:hypothetical protein